MKRRKNLAGKDRAKARGGFVFTVKRLLSFRKEVRERSLEKSVLEKNGQGKDSYM